MITNFMSVLFVFCLLNPESAWGQSGAWFLRVAVEPEVELCGPSKFYCPINRICVPRDERCSTDLKAQNTCPDQRRCYSVSWNPSLNVTGIDSADDEIEAENRFFIYRAYSSILESGSSGAVSGAARAGGRKVDKGRLLLRKQRNVKQAIRTLMFDPWKHSFVQFRGFVYEFGKYGVQELDINDPNYKYDREWTSGWEIVGVSGCGRSDMWRFIRKWNFFRGNYLWYANNCHHFTNAFVKYLNDGCIDQSVL